MTKFIDITIKKEFKKTVFNRIITSSLEIRMTTYFPHEYKNVEYIGHDKHYGDVFKAYNEKNDFTIFFGEKGDDFDYLRSNKKVTTFSRLVTSSGTQSWTDQQPCNFELVEYIGKDKSYGDVFKAYKKENDQECFIIFFGEKGYEFK